MKPAGGRLTYANITSTLALFVALGGAGAFAAGQIAPKSVGERQLRPGAVTAEKLRKNAVIAPKIKALAVKQGKIANGAVSSAKLANEVVGAEKLAAGAVTTEKLGADSVTGEKVDESSLGQVPSAAQADFAISAESANPALFAHINADGSVDGSNSKGIGSAEVKLVGVGVYCIAPPGFNARGAQVTAQFEVGGTGTVTAYVKTGGTASCAAPGVEVRTFEEKNPKGEPFYVALYR